MEIRNLTGTHLCLADGLKPGETLVLAPGAARKIVKLTPALKKAEAQGLLEIRYPK